MGAQKLFRNDNKKIEGISPCGSVAVKRVFGGLDIKKLDTRKTIIVTAALIVSFGMQTLT